MGVSADSVYFSGIFCHRVRDVGGMKLLRIKIRWKGLRSGSFLVRHEMEFLMIFAFLGHFFLS